MMNTTRHPRQDIYYWKCDRSAAFYGLHGHANVSIDSPLARELVTALQRHFGEREILLQPGTGQGNHATFLTTVGGRAAFVRVEDGPDGDDNMEVEAHVLREVARLGVPVPDVLAVDATRTNVPFAWQAIERVPHPDLNRHFKEGRLDLERTAPLIGACIARWQAMMPAGFGPFDIGALRAGRGLGGYHHEYADYFHIRLDEHLDFLAGKEMLSSAQTVEIRREIEQHRKLLRAPTPDARGCLVHKDLALWNILGPPDRIAAFIDWDDAVAGDPMDDISLLACFHDGAAIGRVIEGYASGRALPAEWRRRFWLHLLRNMIWKAVIRTGAGYFSRDSGFFLVGAGRSGADLREFTLQRIATALRGLRADADPLSLL